MKTKTSNLAPMGAVSFYGGVHHKRYSGQRDKWSAEIDFSASEIKIYYSKV